MTASQKVVFIIPGDNPRKMSYTTDKTREVFSGSIQLIILPLFCKYFQQTYRKGFSVAFFLILL
jgi:hypothetical protein